MESHTNNCCRTCLNTQSLHPIFDQAEHHEKYTNILLTATGQKIQLNDSLPQEICTDCISFINSFTKFRSKCEETHKFLVQIKNGTCIFVSQSRKSEIDENEMTKIILPDCEQLKLEDSDFEYEDNISLDSLKHTKSFDGFAKTIKTEIDTSDRTLELKTEISENTLAQKKTRRKPNKTSKTVWKTVEKKTRTPRKAWKFNSKANGQEKKENGTEKEENKEGERIECDICHKILTSKTSLRNHFKIHTGFDVVCEHCGKKFINRRLLLMHCRAKHGYEKTDKCSFCEYTASNAEQVKIHERLHTGERPFACAVCGAGFHRRSSYLQHVAIHLPEKTVLCDQCPARFKSVTLMRIHKNRHRAQQYTFKCLICDNGFTRRRNVVRHLERIHSLSQGDGHYKRIKIGYPGVPAKSVVSSAT